MPTNHRTQSVFTCLLLLLPAAIAAGQSAQVPSAVDSAQHQVMAYLSKLADLHCTESVMQQKFAANGHVEASEQAQYDYLVMIGGNGDDLQLNESRIESSASRSKPLPMLVTNGFSTVLLVFHPYYRDSFQFNVGADEIVDGRELIPVGFSHIPGRRSPAALALRGREFPLDLTGTAWLDRKSGEVVKIDASLLHDMSDVGLRSLTIHVEYKQARLGKASTTMTLPALAVVDVATPRQHWRNTHVFEDYKSFSTDAEQDTKVKIRAENVAPNKDDTTTTAAADAKENQ